GKRNLSDARQSVAYDALIASWKLRRASSTLQRTVDEGYRLADVILLDHPSLYQFARVQHGAVVASAECVSNFIQRRLGQLARQIHRHLSREGDAGRAALTSHIGNAHIKMFRHTPLNLFDRDRMPSFFLQNILQQMLDHLLRKFLAAERC